MKIGIIGAGNVGSAAARLFVNAGHEVALSNSRGPDSLRELVAEIGPKAKAMTVNGAALFGEIILLAIPWRHPEGLPSPELLIGKVVIDAMNPYAPNGSLYDLGEATSSEETQKRLPGSRLVKAFNTIQAGHLAGQGRSDLPMEERRAIFVAGDDSRAKQIVSKLIEEIGFGPVDTGSLREGGRRQTAGSPLSNRNITVREARDILSGSKSAA